MNEAVLTVISLSKVYRRGREAVHALSDVSFALERGELAAVVGPSGSGKSTLLSLAGCMDAPTSGTVRIAGKPSERLSDSERTRLRREQIGFIFQHFALLPTLTVAENVALPAFFARRAANGRVDELLERVGLSHRRAHRPHELSGGEMQRVAIARALVNRPSLLLADEPTGNLDRVASESVIALFQQLRKDGLTILVATHNPCLAAAAARRLALCDGRLSPAGSAPGSND